MPVPAITDFQKISMLRKAGADDERITEWLSAKGHSTEEVTKALEKATVDTWIPGPIGVQQVGPFMARHAIPAVATLLAKSPTARGVVGGTAAGLGEFVARGIERGEASADPAQKFNDYFSALLSGTTAAAGERYLGPAMAWTGKQIKRPFRWGLEKILIPGTKGAMNRMQRVTYDVLKSLGSSPTPAQVSSGGTATFIESMSRGAIWGRAGMLKIDEANLSLVNDLAMDYLEAHARIGWQPKLVNASGETAELARMRFGKIVRGFINRDIDLAKKLTSKAFGKYRSLIEDKNLTTDIASLKEFLTANVQNMKLRPVLAKMRYLLQGAKVDEDVAERALIAAAEAGEELTDEMAAAITNALPPVIPVENATEILRTMNTFLGERGTPGTAWAAGKVKGAIRPAVEDSLNQVPGALKSFDDANALYGRFADRLYKKTTLSLMKTLKESPSKMVQTIMSGAHRADNLTNIQNLFIKGYPGETRLSQKVYEKHVLRPLRHHIFSKAMDRDTGKITGKALASTLDKLSDDFKTKAFGSKAAWQGLRDLATTSKHIESTQYGDKVFIKLIQGGLITATAIGGGVFQMEALAAGVATTIFLFPAATSAVLRRPAFTRALVDGMREGVETKAWQRMTGMLTALAAKEKGMQKALSPEAYEFYSNPAIQDDLIQSTASPDEKALPQM